jgi:acyl-CoA oxidase
MMMAADAERVRRFLDGRWGWVRDLVREQAQNPLFHPVPGIGMHEHRERILQQMHEVARTDVPAYLFPEAYGGKDDVGAAITAFETVGCGDLSLLVKAGVHWGLYGGALHHLGTARHHEQHLPQVISFEVPGCFAMTETGHGSDVQSIRTTATYDPETQEFILHTPDEDARKDYIGNAADHGRMAAVFAQLITQGQSHGVHCFLVPIRDDDHRPCPGVTISDCGHKAGLNGVDNGRLVFDRVRLPREALLNRYGDVAPDGTYTSPIENETRRFFTQLGTLVKGRVSVAGAGLSAAKTALVIAVRYGLARRQFSPPDSDQEILILDFLQHQRRLLPALASTYAIHFAQEALVAHLHEAMSTPDYPEREQRKLESMAAGLKASATWHATHTIQTCREACGGAGYLSENRLPELKADTDVFTTFEGDNTVLLQLVAKGLLTDYRDEFGDLDTLGMVRFVADQVYETVIERTAARKLIQALIDAVPGGRDDETDLLDRGYHLELFEWREKHVIDGLARRLRAGVSSGADLFDVFNEAQDHVLLAARVHMDRVVLEHFVAGIDRCEDAEVAELLATVCDLHVMSNLEKDRAWFLEHGRFSAPRAKAVTAAVNDLCGRLRPHAELLVDAFGIPDQTIAAPIALGDEARRQAVKAFPNGQQPADEFAPRPG